MKNSLALGLLLLANIGLAEDYYAPIKKELEPLARLPMPEYTLTEDSLQYTLPRDITGRLIQVDLKRENPGPDQLPRIYKGPLASVACMGTDQLPACVVSHKNLNIQAEEVSKFLNTKYKDPQKLSDALAVAATFSAGNEPLGFMSKRSLPTTNAMPHVWNVQVLRFGENSTVNPDAMAELNMDSQEFKIVGESQGFKLNELSEDAFHISASYAYYKDTRWIDLTIATDKLSFEGTWGLYDASGAALPASGTLKGSTL